MERSIKSIRMVLLISLFVLLAAPMQVLAEEATPRALLEGLGLETVNVSVTAEGIEAPSEAPAGPVLLVVHNQTDGFAFVDIVRLPEEIDVDGYLEATGGEGAIPGWASEVVIAGGAEVPPGASGHVGLVLEPGEYTVVAGSETPIPVSSASLMAVGEASAEAADAVPADLNVDMGHYTFDFPDTVAPGQQVWRVTNSHEGVLHHLIVIPTDRLYTVEEVQEGIMGDFSGTPVPDGFSLFSLAEEDAASSPVISSGQTVWIEANMEPGYYVAICFLPDPGQEVPHFVFGMIDTFEVVAD